MAPVMKWHELPWLPALSVAQQYVLCTHVRVAVPVRAERGPGFLRGEIGGAVVLHRELADVLLCSIDSDDTTWETEHKEIERDKEIAQQLHLALGGCVEGWAYFGYYIDCCDMRLDGL